MDQYDRLAILGHGAFGVAHLVRERTGASSSSSSAPAAAEDAHGLLRVVKEIDISAMPASAQAEAMAEVSVLRSLSHPNIVAYSKAFAKAKKLYIVMEFADGGDLSKAIRQRRDNDNPYEESDVLSIFSQCCLALRHTHAMHVIHRDLKSQNIFMTKAGVVKLGDFGIAKVLDHTAAEAKTQIGTPTYLSPEVCDNRPYGFKADMWSIGVVLHELMALERPFIGQNVAALFYKILAAEPGPLPDRYSYEARDLVARLLQKCPDDRPSASQLLECPVLRAQLPSLPAEARSGSRDLSAIATPASPSSARSSPCSSAKPSPCGSTPDPVCMQASQAAPRNRGHSRPPSARRSLSRELRAQRIDPSGGDDECTINPSCAEVVRGSETPGRSRPPLAPNSSALAALVQRQRRPNSEDAIAAAEAVMSSPRAESLSPSERGAVQETAGDCSLSFSRSPQEAEVEVGKSPSPAATLGRGDLWDTLEDSWSVDPSPPGGGENERTLLPGFGLGLPSVPSSHVSPAGEDVKQQGDKDPAFTVDCAGDDAIHPEDRAFSGERAPDDAIHSDDGDPRAHDLLWDTLKDMHQLAKAIASSTPQDVPHWHEDPDGHRSAESEQVPAASEWHAAREHRELQDAEREDPVMSGGREASRAEFDGSDGLDFTRLLRDELLAPASSEQSLHETRAPVAPVASSERQVRASADLQGDRCNTIPTRRTLSAEDNLAPEHHSALEEARREARLATMAVRARQQSECELDDFVVARMHPPRVRSSDVGHCREAQPSSTRAAKISENRRSASPPSGRSAPASARKAAHAEVRSASENPTCDSGVETDCLRIVPVHARMHDEGLDGSPEFDLPKIDRRTSKSSRATCEEGLALHRLMADASTPRDGKNAKARIPGNSTNCSRQCAAVVSAQAGQVVAARTPKEAAEAEHRRALAEAAAQTRLDRRRVIEKMRILERSNAETLRDRGGAIGDDHMFQALRHNHSGDENAIVQGGGDGLQKGRPISASRRRGNELPSSAAATRPRVEVRIPAALQPVASAERRTSRSGGQKPPRIGPLGRGG